MFLMFGLKRLDVFPVGDLGLRNAMTRQYRMRKSGSLQRFHRIANRWHPYRTVGSLYLWKGYDGA
jgi:DNA-3-methyladenine glycosylase II